MSSAALRPTARFETLGVSAGAGTLAGAGTTPNKGSWVTLGTTGFAYDGFTLIVTHATGVRGVAFDIGLGATPDIIVADALVEFVDSNDIAVLHLPLAIPAGVDVKVRTACTTSSNTSQIALQGYAYNHLKIPGLKRAEQLAAISSVRPNNAVTETGTTPTAWTEIVASTARAYKGLSVAGNTGGDTSRTGAHILYELAKGAAGSEVVFASFWGKNNLNGMLVRPQWVDEEVPAGTRLSFRVTTSSGAAADSAACSLLGAF